MTLSVTLATQIPCCKMSVVARGFCKYFQHNNNILKTVLDRNGISLQVVRTSYFDRQSKHNDKDYDYEVTYNPSEWKFVERLIPPRIIPEIKKKEKYPSGWRPQSEDAKNQPYFTERSKNHMLPVYLHFRLRGDGKYTVLRHIRGDIWQLYEDLKKHLESELKKSMYMRVHEGNCYIQIKGDVVYYVEQWLLSKGM